MAGDQGGALAASPAPAAPAASPAAQDAAPSPDPPAASGDDPAAPGDDPAAPGDDPAAPALAPPERLDWGAAIGASFLATIDRPRIWPLALAAFLVRGGIVVLALPILVLPTPAGLATILGPFVSGIALGGLGPQIALAGLAIAVTAVALVVASGLAAARLDLALIADAASNEPLDQPGQPPRVTTDGLAVSAFLARLLAFVPLVAALGYGTVRIIAATYRELVSPADVTTPIALRVIEAVPEVIAVILIAWIAGEVVGGLAVRHLAAGPQPPSPLRAIAAALVFVVRHPLAVLGTTLATDLWLLAALVPSVLAAAVGWQRVATILATSPDGALGPVLGLVTIWLAGLVLVAVAVAWRQTAWTFEVLRHPTRPAERTEGGAGPQPRD